MANKTEFKIGEEFQCGLVRLKCIEAKISNSCIGCFFGDVYECDDEVSGNCGFNEIRSKIRSDKKNVIFVKVEE